eukprot:11772185-Alexandrium_andersonii.AAC.1
MAIAAQVVLVGVPLGQRGTPGLPARAPERIFLGPQAPQFLQVRVWCGSAQPPRAALIEP